MIDEDEGSPVDAIGMGVGQTFTEHLAARLGVHPKAVKRLGQIAKSLSPAVRAAVRGTDAADNQSLLLSIAKRPPAEQQAIVSTMQARQLDLPTVLKQIRPAPAKVDAQTAALEQLLSAWKRADAATRAKFLAHIQPQEAQG